MFTMEWPILVYFRELYGQYCLNIGYLGFPVQELEMREFRALSYLKRGWDYGECNPDTPVGRLYCGLDHRADVNLDYVWVDGIIVMMKREKG